MINPTNPRPPDKVNKCGRKDKDVAQLNHIAPDGSQYNLQRQGEASILLLMTNFWLTCSVYIQWSNCPFAWLTSY